MRKNNDLYVRITLFIIITAGFLLRINHWFDFLGADEIGKTGLMTWSWDFHKDPFPVHYYPPFFLYLNFLFSFVLKKLVIFLGIIDFNNIFQNTDFGFIFTLKTGRILSALFGTFNIYMIYLLGKEFFNKYSGLAAALILAVFWPHVIDSHNFKSDILLTLLITVTAYYALKFYRSRKPAILIVSSVFLGLSVATKFNGVFFGVIILLPLFYLRKEFSFIKGLLYAAAGGAAGFFLGAPNWLVHPVSNVKITLQYLKGLAEELVWYDQFPSSFILYGKNILEHFGIFLIVIFIAGIIFGFVRKNRETTIISVSMIVYFILTGRENYLNYRAVLPLIPLIALVIGAFIFTDLKEIIMNARIRRAVMALALIPVVIYSVGNFTRSCKSFDLLKGIASHPVRERAGIGEPDYSSYFMNNHFWSSSFIFREMWTPPATGFRGAVFGRDITRVPEKLFTGKRKFDFLITSFSTDYILHKSRNLKFITAAKKRLKNYLPFHKVDRPAIFTWSDDIQFWYRRPGYVRGNLRSDKGLILPRGYVPDPENPSVHLPLQRYEKDPCYGIIKDGISGKFIFSSRKINKIAFNYVAGMNRRIIIDVNGKRVVSNSGKGELTCSAIVPKPVPQKFGDTAIRRLYETTIDKEELNTYIYIYKIEILANTRVSIPYTFNAGFIGEEGTDPVSGTGAGIVADHDEGVPELFSENKAPVWVRSFFKKTGIDPLLLFYMNTLEVFTNRNGTVADITTGYFPAGKGRFIFNVEAVKILGTIPAGSDAEIRITYISGNNRNEIRLIPEEGVVVKEVDFKGGPGFFKINSSGTRGSNLLIKKISVVPDFKSYLTY